MSVKPLTLFLSFLISSSLVTAQDTLVLTREQAEAVFVKENLLLIAEKLEVEKAEAMVIQAKLWPNPTFGIDEVNLWATRKQLDVFGDDLKGFGNSNFGKNQQVSLSIEQIILTAGKRKKRVDVEQVAVDQSKQEFEEVLRNLKLTFRNNLTDLQFLQQSIQVYLNQINAIRLLANAHKRQVDLGNIPRGEYIRLKALELEFSKEINELTLQINDAQKELKILMRIPAYQHLKIVSEQAPYTRKSLSNITFENLLDSARLSRPDLKLTKLDQDYYGKLYSYERAQRVPDLTASGGYDRGGNFMYNFVGFGLAMDLPFFNRNQGNIRHAKVAVQQAEIKHHQQQLIIENEIASAYKNLITSIDFNDQIEEGYENTLDQLLSAYTKNFAERNINLLEFLDFLEAYLDNKTIILEATKNISEKAEELNYTVGTDVVKIK